VPLILAIDSDRSQSEQLALLMRRLRVDLMQATSAGEGLRALQDRIPDLILASPLLSPLDDSLLEEYLRELGPEGAHVQTLRIPVLSAVSTPSERSLFGLGRTQAPMAGPDPDVFADEISEYLACAQERKLSASRIAAPPMIETPPPVAARPVASQSESFDQRVMSTNPFIGAETINRRTAAPIKRKEAVVARDASDAFEDHEPTAVIEPMKHHEAPKTIAAPARIVAPAPVFVAPQRRVVEPPATRAAPARVGPLAASASRARVERPASGRATVVPGTITSFETALAAIRAAWVAQGLASMSANTAKANESRIVTREIVKRGAAAESGRQAVTPAAPVASPKATQIDPREQDEGGVFDPNRTDVSTLVDNPEEVAERDAQPPPATTKVRIISVG